MTLNLLVSLQCPWNELCYLAYLTWVQEREFKVYNLTSFGKTEFEGEANF